MRAAMKEVEQLERNAREDAGLPVEPEEGAELPPITLPRFKEMQKQMRSKRLEERKNQEEALTQKLAEIEAQMDEVQSRLKSLNKEPDAYKENISRNGDSSENRRKSIRASAASSTAVVAAAAVTAEEEPIDETKGALVPDGEFVEFPEYDGSEPPKEPKKAFALYCNRNRKKVKASIDPEELTKEKVNGVLKERFTALSADEKQYWRGWATWEKKRYASEVAIYEQSQNGVQNGDAAEEDQATHVPKKKRRQSEGEGESIHVPKKKKKRSHG
jgi:hypothetical protein